MSGKNDKLEDYRKKRDFERSPEPEGAAPAAAGTLSFVVQKHKARALHYDFRLELDGVLKSWAVPKGPSMDPGQKRLAVQVEDHPLEYADFQGEIPPGQYGAGSVEIWDSGTWEPLEDPSAGIEKGSLKFKLRGGKLSGGWALVRMRGRENKKQEWLLIKEKDRFAEGAREDGMPEGSKKADMPLFIAPQLATLVDRIPEGEGWGYEIKFDGYRILARIDRGEVKLFTRSGKDWTARFGSLAAEIIELGIQEGWLDGEIVVLGKNGLPDFGALQDAYEKGLADEIIYYVFDMPYYKGYDLRDVRLSDRKALLEELVSETSSGRIRLSGDFGGKGGDVLLSACSLGLEGLIGKRLDSRYLSGRSQEWIKLKCRRRQEFAVAGYTDSKRGPNGIGALLLGVYDESGRLRYAGKVGSGFDMKTSGMLKEKLMKLETEQARLPVKAEEAGTHWVVPELVAEVSFAEWTKDGLVRQAVFHGLRSDKPAGEAVKEKPVIMISNPDRVIDQSTGFKKIDLVEYYRLASERMLPYLKGRPVSFLRAPSGLAGEMFFQKHDEALAIPGIKQLSTEFDPGHQPLLEISTLKALVGAAQMNVVEFHTWNATSKNIEKPDRMVFDLDPGQGVSWPKVAEAAGLVRTMLEELGLVSFVKTSGGKGLHIVVPLSPRDGWDAVKAFSKAVSEHLAKVIPSIFTATSGPDNRQGRIFVDYIRNTRGATTVEAFSARARPGLGVSMPCSWGELTQLNGGNHWNIASARVRLEETADPWADYFSTKQMIGADSKEMLGLRKGEMDHDI
jgi:bifunctional non-homologous end joining protein LigD